MPARTPSCRLREVLYKVPAPLNYPPQNRVPTRSLAPKLLQFIPPENSYTPCPKIQHAQSWMRAPLGSTAQAEALRVKRFKSFSLRPRCLTDQGTTRPPGFPRWKYTSDIKQRKTRRSMMIFPNNDPTTQTAETSHFVASLIQRSSWQIHILIPLAIPSIPSPEA